MNNTCMHIIQRKKRNILQFSIWLRSLPQNVPGFYYVVPPIYKLVYKPLQP